jgi:sarcosine oxidase subunit alpha
MTEEALRRSPLYEALQAAGAGFEVRSGWWVPASLLSAADDAVTVLTIVDESAHGKLLLEGERASTVIAAVLGVQPPAVGMSVPIEGGRMYALRPDFFFVATHPGAEAELVERLHAAVGDAGGMVAVTDVTDGRSQIRVSGSVCRQLLPKLCGLDFGERSFPDGCGKISSLARTTQLILRCDHDGVLSFRIVGGRSLGAYVWETMVQAGSEWGISPVVGG